MMEEIKYKISHEEIKEGDFAINTDDKNAKPRKVEVFSDDNDTLGYHQKESWFTWIPIGSRHKKVVFNNQKTNSSYE